MGRAEARDLNLFGGTLFEPGFSRKTTPGPPALDIDPDSGIEFRSEEHTSELQSLMRISYAVFCLTKTTTTPTTPTRTEMSRQKRTKSRSNTIRNANTP